MFKLHFKLFKILIYKYFPFFGSKLAIFLIIEIVL